MSVFRDFQTAWSQRFPGNDLPKAWEDDVRGNLDKHRQKLEQLKEELEKEEFYVQYLENLLSDVESKKQRPSFFGVNNGGGAGQASNSGSPSSTRSSPSSTFSKKSDQCQLEEDSGLNHHHSLPLLSQPGQLSQRQHHHHHQQKHGQSSKNPNHNQNQSSFGAASGSGNSTPGGDSYVTVITVSSSGDLDSNKKGKSMDTSLTENPLYKESNVQSSTTTSATSASASPPSATNNYHQVQQSSVDFNQEQEHHHHSLPPLSSSATATSDQPIIIDSQPKKIILDNNNGAGNNSINNINNNNVRKKRPPTPPRKPKINRNDLFALQSLGSRDHPSHHHPLVVNPVEPMPLITSEITSKIKPVRCLTESPEMMINPVRKSEVIGGGLPPPTIPPPEPPSLTPNEPFYAVKDISELTTSIPTSYPTYAEIQHVQHEVKQISESEKKQQEEDNCLNHGTEEDEDDDDAEPLYEEHKCGTTTDEDDDEYNHHHHHHDIMHNEGDEKLRHYGKCEDEVSVIENLMNSEVTTDEDKDEDLDEEEEEESIYDTVAPDEFPLDGQGGILDSSHRHDDDDEDFNNLNKPPPLFNKSKPSSVERNFSKPQLSEMHSFANYVNIDYFLRREESSSKNDSDDNDTQLSQSISSDHEIDLDSSHLVDKVSTNGSGSHDGHLRGRHRAGNNNNRRHDESVETVNQTYDEVFESSDYAGYYGVLESKPNSPNSCQEVSTPLDDEEAIKAENERRTMYRSILSSVAESEAVYVDCLSTLIQYKKAFKASTESAHPLLSPEDLEIIFYKIPDLYTIHSTFLDGIKRLLLSMSNSSTMSSSSSSSKDTSLPTTGPLLGDLFKVLASRLGAYSSYLKNYAHALETVRKCVAANNQFSELTRVIKLKSLKGQTTSLEELLHKPVARVQKNALVLHDLLKYTKENQSEYKAVKTALKMTQCFLNELNIAATEQMFPVQDKTQRRLVKESFIIEVSEGRRKLRHLFLFNDIIVCAKYKPSTRQKFTFDVKWYTLLTDVTIPDCDDSITATSKEKEINTEIINLKCRLNSIRDMMFKERSKPNNKVIEKLKKKQADLEGQLVLLLPQLSFVICHKSGKNYTFYLSSEFERTQWIESITVLQQSVTQTHEQINLHELQAWIETCRKGLKPSLGSFLLRTSKDEDLYYGDLFLTVHSLKGLSRPADLFFTIETDTYGHFFQKAVTKTCKDSLTPQFEQEFVLDLDGSQTLRIVCYEEVAGRAKPFLRGRAAIEFSRSWLQDKTVTREVPIVDSSLLVSFKFVPSEKSTTRFPARKLYGAFGVNIQQVSKKEKSNVPYLIVACVREVERRGMKEVGIYRVSGLSSDVQKLKKAFETNPYEAEFLLKEIDIHAVTGLLKMYLRELPEALFTNSNYKKFFDAFSSTNEEEKKTKLIELFAQLPPVNQNTINFLIEHLAHVNEHEQQNKMSLHNLATVFGPTAIRPGPTSSGSSSEDQFTAGTIDVMAQAGILYFFLRRKAMNETVL